MEREKPMQGKAIRRAVVILDQASGALREDGGQVLGLDLWPQVRADLEALAERGVECFLGVPAEAEMKGIERLHAFAPFLRIIPLPPRFCHARNEEFAAGLGLEPGEAATALVSADRRLRGNGARAGLIPAPHVAILPMLAEGHIIRAARLVAARETLLRFGYTARPVPMHFQPTGKGGEWAMIALISEEMRKACALRRIGVEILPCDPLTEDLFWLRPDPHAPMAEKARAALEEREILHGEAGQLLVAMKPCENALALNIHGAHGHSEYLQPDPGLLRPAPRSCAGRIPGDLPEMLIEKPRLDPRWLDLLRLTRPLCDIVTAHYADDLDRYTGAASLDADGPIISRHSLHPDNKRVEKALLADLAAMGYCPWRHDFIHAGVTHSNIIADLPGRGDLAIRADILARYRDILHRGPIPFPLRQWEREIGELADCEWFARADLAQMPDHEILCRIEEIFHLRPWYPWWKKLCRFHGLGADIVLVGCHFDSTAGFEPVYAATVDPAPGRDDNGSGLAATLSIARNLRALEGRLTHTVRFCFFNAEESGLVGSKAYAAAMKALDAPIRATICTDMMGYNSDENRLFEIHAGYTDPAIRDISLPIAQSVADAAAAYGTLAPAQTYRGTSWSGAPDRTVFDGGINRSDHAAFHQQGYGAVLVSEDFFANLAGEPGADPNPGYHRQSDTFVDLDYARAITCAINKAVINLAL